MILDGEKHTRTRPGTGLDLCRSDDPGPREAVEGFTRALLHGEAGAAAAFFSPGARLLTPDGTEVGGRRSIAGLLEQLVTPDHILEIRTGRILHAESTALCTQFWRRIPRSTESPSLAGESTARLVLQRLGSRWRIVIATPWTAVLLPRS